MSQEAGSSRLRIMTILGTRPEAVKLAPVVQEIRRHPEQLESRLLITAQHRDMLDPVLEIFGLVPDDDLDLMRPGQDLFDITSNGLMRIRDVLRRGPPHLVLVQGDTTTTFVGALAAFYERIRVGHVEAGLRTWDRYQPYPEEMNRRLVGNLADVHFPPTEGARQNLLREGFEDSRIVVTGNPGIDALLDIAGRHVKGNPEVLDRIPQDARMILVTAHRRESFGEPLQRIIAALVALIERRPEVHIVYPVHQNPNVRGPVHDALGSLDRVHLLAPLDYLDFVPLMKRAHLILTDSGGVQEEAPSLGIPVLVLRETTERPEGIEAGTVRLVGTITGTIIAAVEELLDDGAAHAAMARAANPYGDGQAARRIVGWILDHGEALIRPGELVAHS